jgi:hypothetical protein
MKQANFTFSMLAATVLMAGMTIGAMTAPPANAQISLNLGGWQQPPPDYNQVRRQGFHDGIDAARHDLDRGAPPLHAVTSGSGTRLPDVTSKTTTAADSATAIKVAYEHRRDYDRNRHDWNDQH